MATESLTFSGLAGTIDCAIDYPEPEVPIQGWALVLHPHPLYGGTRDNKVVTTVGRALLQKGMVVLRPSFRGVGLSEGEFDHGQGELADMLSLLDQFEARFPQYAQGATALSGFSFGSAVASQLLATLTASQHTFVQRLHATILVGTAVKRFDVATMPESTLVIHGEVDDTVPLIDVLDWARPQVLPVLVIPGADHFFHKKLSVLKRAVLSHLTVSGL